jgi:mRNA interferase MazF
VKIDRGTVVLVELNPTVGHEQRGVRPCIAVSDPTVNADQRFPMRGWEYFVSRLKTSR